MPSGCGAGRGRGRFQAFAPPQRSPVPRQGGDWEPVRWGRARLPFNLQLRRDYSFRIVSNTGHWPPGAACPSPQQRHRGEEPGRCFRSPLLLAPPGSLPSPSWSSVLGGWGRSDPSPPRPLTSPNAPPHRIHSFPTHLSPGFLSQPGSLSSSTGKAPGPGSSGRWQRPGAVCFAVLLPLPSPAAGTFPQVGDRSCEFEGRALRSHLGPLPLPGAWCRGLERASFR